MSVKKGKRSIKAVIFIVFMLASLNMGGVDYAFAFRGRPEGHSERRIVHRLPPRHGTVWVGRSRYYYHGGHFYRRAPDGYISVHAPIGAIILGIPVGSRALLIGGLTYYVYDDVYYRRVSGKYLVVEPPAQSVVVREIPPVVPSKESLGEKVSVVVPLLNVRSGPGTTFPVIHEIRRDLVLTIHGYAPDWLYVELPSGEFGWVMLRYTTPLSEHASG